MKLWPIISIICMGCPFVVVVFTVYGPYQRPEMAIHKFTRMILNEAAVPVYNFGNCERDYTYIDDIIHGLLANGHAYDFDIVNLGESATFQPMP